MVHEEFTGVTFNDLDPPGTRISRSSEFTVVIRTDIALNITQKAYILPQRGYVTFRYLLSQIRPSVVCLSSTFVRLTQAVKTFGDISSPLCTLAIL